MGSQLLRTTHPSDTRRGTCWPLWCLVLAVAGSLAVTPLARAHADWLNYTWEDGTPECLYAVDPVTTAFYGAGDSFRTFNHIEWHTGWGAPVGGITEEPQDFFTHGSCVNYSGERANDVSANSRFHIRLRQTLHEDPELGTVSVGSPHWEDVESCGLPKHAVHQTVNGWSGYDEGRYRLYLDLGGAHYTYTTFRGNTIDFEQCDGGWAGSNGNLRWFQIPMGTH